MKISVVEAMSVILLRGGYRATPAVVDKVASLLIEILFDEDENLRLGGSSLALGVGPFLDLHQLNILVAELMEVPVGGEPYNQTCGRAIGLSSLLVSAGNTKLGDKKDDIFTYIISPSFHDERGNGAIQIIACKCVALLLTPPKHSLADSAVSNKIEGRVIAQAAIHKFAKDIVSAALDVTSSEVRRTALLVIKQVRSTSI